MMQPNFEITKILHNRKRDFNQELWLVAYDALVFRHLKAGMDLGEATALADAQVLEFESNPLDLEQPDR